jgi:NAD(P)H-hydrate repair Nnr-like enzyme with NAD(P)H-hydrate dehydratase domain
MADWAVAESMMMMMVDMIAAADNFEGEEGVVVAVAGNRKSVGIVTAVAVAAGTGSLNCAGTGTVQPGKIVCFVAAYSEAAADHIAAAVVAGYCSSSHRHYPHKSHMNRHQPLAE